MRTFVFINDTSSAIEGIGVIYSEDGSLRHDVSAFIDANGGGDAGMLAYGEHVHAEQERTGSHVEIWDTADFHGCDGGLVFSKLYRDAWKKGHPDNVDIAMAKEIAHSRRRAKRDAVFAPHIAVTSKAAQGIPLKPGEDAAAAAQAMTDYKTSVDDVAQSGIDAATTVSELEVIETANGFI